MEHFEAESCRVSKMRSLDRTVTTRKPLFLGATMILAGSTLLSGCGGGLASGPMDSLSPSISGTNTGSGSGTSTTTTPTPSTPSSTPSSPDPTPSATGATILSDIQTRSGDWSSFGQVGPAYIDCNPSPCDGIAWSQKYDITNPSLSNNATQFNLGGKVPYGDVLFTTGLIGQTSPQTKDSDHRLLPTLHNFTYDVDFYLTNVSITQAEEFDISLWLGAAAGMTFGTECNHLGDGDWDVWDNETGHWISAGVPCKFVDGWNHLTIQFQRQSDNSTLYKSIALNGTTYVLNLSYPAMTSPPTGWWGLNVNYQMDGNYKQSANTTYLDNLSVTYW